MHYINKKKIGLIVSVFFLFAIVVFLKTDGITVNTTNAQTEVNWPMAGANPQRTSWVSQGVKGLLKADWAKPIEAYIPQKVQIVAADNKVFLSTAKGLYAFNASDGNQVWVYPTSMPLGHSPTYVVEGSSKFLYVAGHDRKIHKVNATNGTKVWTYEAGGGFAVNPLVVNGVIYAGSRDGKMYAVNSNGTLKWSFDTGAPISQSAAFADNNIYFASNNMFAYALDASSGTQVWKSAKLPGIAVNSWWPVVNGTSVYFTTAVNFKGKLMAVERDDMYGGTTLPDGTPYGTVSYPSGDHMTMTTSKMITYLNGNPGRRTLVVLNRSTGVEKTPYAPALWGGMTGSLTRFPPIVDTSGRLYFRNHTYYDGAIPGGHVTGWDEGSTNIKIVSNREQGGWGDYPIDEPGAMAAGGDVIYHTHCCARFISSYDVSVPNTWPLNNGLFPVVSPTTFTDPSKNRQWRATGWRELNGYDSQFSQFFLGPEQTNNNGGGATPPLAHADNNPPIPYNGKVYVHRGNALMALSPSGTGQLKPTASAPSTPISTFRTKDHLKTLLTAEIQKILSAGHLKPGMYTVGHHDNNMDEVEEYMLDLFHNPSETYIILLRALPHLSSTLQTQVRAYLQNEWNSGYAATNVTHVGFGSGAAREYHVPIESKNSYSGKRTGTSLINYYASWKYAKEFGNASSIFNALPSLPAPLSNTEYDGYPQKLNEYIAGYYGYIELAKMTGNPFSTQQNTLNTLISLKNQQWKTIPANPLSGGGSHNYYITPLATNFMYIQPEFADDLNTSGKGAATFSEFNSIFPYWFLAKGTETQGEGTLQPPQYYHAMFQAKARMLNHNYAQLEPYLDAPAYAVGDLYYIDNIVAALDAPIDPNFTPPPTTATPVSTPTSTPTVPGDANGDSNVDGLDYVVWLNNYNLNTSGGASKGDFDGSGKVDGLDYVIWLNNYGGGSATPPPSATPVPSGGGGSLFSASGVSHRTTLPSTSELKVMADEVITQVNQGLNGAQPKLILVYTNAGLNIQVGTSTQTVGEYIKSQVNSNARLGGMHTGADKYPPLSNSYFPAPTKRSLSALALGGSAIEDISMVTELTEQTFGRSAAEYYSDSNSIGNKTGDFILANAADYKNKSNLFIPTGPYHGDTFVVEVINGLTDGLASKGIDTSFIKFIGAGGTDNSGSSYNDTWAGSRSLTGLFISGNFNLAISGQSGFQSCPAGPVGSSTTHLTNIKNQLGGTPNALIYIPGHPDTQLCSHPDAQSVMDAMRNTIPAVFGSSVPAIGTIGGSEIGHLTTSSAPIGEVFHMFIAGLKGN